jgi:hypothetical protein
LVFYPWWEILFVNVVWMQIYIFNIFHTFICLCLVCPVLPVSLYCPSLIVPSVFSNVYLSLSFSRCVASFSVLPFFVCPCGIF